MMCTERFAGAGSLINIFRLHYQSILEMLFILFIFKFTKSRIHVNSHKVLYFHTNFVTNVLKNSLVLKSAYNILSLYLKKDPFSYTSTVKRTTRGN